MRRIVNLRSERPLLDLVSYGRRAPGHRRAFTATEVAHAMRTARGAPEVVVKVSGGGRTAKGVGANLDYIGREGELEIETNDGQHIRAAGFERRIIKDWNLDLEERKGHKQRTVAKRRKPPKLVHGIVFSMPKGTPPKKLYAAVRKFAQEKFALQHRYLMALHTDQDHPHVHLVVKAVSEQGQRLNIRKATLREWRRDFAAHLREFGVEANATERAVRGVSKPRKTDAIYRAARRGVSTHYSERLRTVADELRRRTFQAELGLTKLVHTRDAVLSGWHSLADHLETQGHRDDARAIRAFTANMRPVRTEKQWFAEQLIQSIARARKPAPPERVR